MTDDYQARRNANQQFWRDRAQRFGASLKATASTDWVRDGTLRDLRRVIRPGDRVLEVGCGNGNLLAPLAARCRVFGIDLTMEMLRIAKTQQSIARLACSDAALLPFRSDSFDVVFSSRCLINIQDRAGQASALRELLRVVRPGGTVVISENFEQAISRLRNLKRLARISMPPRRGLTHPLPLKETIGLILENGWSVERIRGYPMSYLYVDVMVAFLAQRRWGSVSHRLLSPFTRVLARADAVASAFLPIFGHDTSIIATRPVPPPRVSESDLTTSPCENARDEA